MDKGYVPVAPHLLFPQFLDDNDPKERQLGLFFGNALMSKCAEVWVFGSTISAGMEAEIKRAKWKDYRLRYFSARCVNSSIDAAHIKKIVEHIIAGHDSTIGRDCSMQPCLILAQIKVILKKIASVIYRATFNL